MIDCFEIIEAVVEKIEIRIDEHKVEATHYMRPVDLPDDVPTYMANLMWQWPPLDRLFEDRDAAEAANHIRIKATFHR
jgi:hypothetical protein